MGEGREHTGRPVRAARRDARLTLCMVPCTFTAKFPLGDEDMARKKISTTIYITPEQNDRLKLLHERTKVPVAV